MWTFSAHTLHVLQILTGKRTCYAVEDDITNGEKLIQVSHNKVGEKLDVYWIQVIETGDEPLLPLEMKASCCVWPKKD